VYATYGAGSASAAGAVTSALARCAVAILIRQSVVSVVCPTRCYTLNRMQHFLSLHPYQETLLDWWETYQGDMLKVVIGWVGEIGWVLCKIRGL
jgi:hypothetical protein